MSEPSVAARGWTGKWWILLAAALAAALIAGAWLLWLTPATPTATGVGQTVADDGAGGVTFKATLKARLPGTLFTVALDTHTVDVGAYDLRNVVLRGGSGADIPAQEVRTIVTSQHHVEADLTFSPTQGGITLVAKDLGGVPERKLVFR